MPYHRGVSVTKLGRFLLRLPKNLRSNRLWIYWGGAIYLRSSVVSPFLTFTESRLKDSWLTQAKFYKRLNPASPRLGKSSEQIGVVVSELGRFGNMVRRLANALQTAHHLGCKDLIVPRDVIFHKEIFAKTVYEVGNSKRVWFGVEPSRRRNSVDAIIAHDFFSRTTEKSAETMQTASKAWSGLRELLQGYEISNERREKWLTIHLRSGDVFGSRDATGYGQPPLAFYQLVLDSDSWEGVTLVYQDTSNPVVIELKNYCESLGMTVELQSGMIHDDLRVLLSARTLVAGRGTFIPGVAGLSSECERIFYFEDKCNLVPRRSGIELIRVSDKNGTYRETILSNNWHNTPEQRELMLTYPLSSLVMEGS